MDRDHACRARRRRARPSSPSTTARTSASSRTQTPTTSLAAATSRGESARARAGGDELVDGGRARDRRRWSRARRRTSRRAIGWPMLPRPTKPARSVMAADLTFNLPCMQYVNGAKRRGGERPAMLEYDPYAYEIHEDPVPDLRRAARRGAGLPQRAPRLLGAVAARRRARRLPGLAALLEPQRRLARSRRRRIRGRHATMSFLAMDPPRHTRMRALVSRGFTPRRVAELEPRIRELARQHLDRFVGAGPLRLHPRLRRQAPDGRDQRDARRARGRPRPAARAGPTPSCTARRA